LHSLTIADKVIDGMDSVNQAACEDAKAFCFGGAQPRTGHAGGAMTRGGLPLARAARLHHQGRAMMESGFFFLAIRMGFHAAY
ncbi:MAG: hypothetical protein ACP5MD_04695, partial [Verrucomicrobiia bacterium]